MYENYLYPTWAYFRFHYNPPPTSCIMLAWILSVTPSLRMPMRLTRPSQLAYWVLYITVFIPSMFLPLYAGLDAAVFGQLFVYSVGGKKGAFLSIAFIWGFYAVFRVGRHPFALKLVFGTLVLLGGLCVS